jgi:hypothetical protein
MQQNNIGHAPSDTRQLRRVRQRIGAVDGSLIGDYQLACRRFPQRPEAEEIR